MNLIKDLRGGKNKGEDNAVERNVIGGEVSEGSATAQAPRLPRAKAKRKQPAMGSPASASAAKQTKKKDKRRNFNGLRLIPLGGLGEIGKNITVLEYGNEILIIDCGMAFPTDETPGINIIIPDFTYLKENQKKIKGIIFTHAHEDHIGSVPYFLKEISAPLFGTKLTLALIKNKTNEHGLKPDFRTIEYDKKIRISEHFTVDVIKSTHSIPESVALAIQTPVGVIYHTGDFKIDDTPIDEEPINFQKIAEIGKRGVRLMLSDSTNATLPGTTRSERYLRKVMENVFSGNDGRRIIIATFASNIHRVQTIIDKSIEHGRKVALSGFSLDKVIDAARELKIMKASPAAFVNIKETQNIPDKELTIITTGSQGEPMAALTRIANDNHKYLQVKKGDCIVLSSSPIPGNEKAISQVIDKLLAKGANVIYSDIADIHVSGHARQEELKTMLKLIGPQHFMPVHGEIRHLLAHKNLAEELGIPEEKIFVLKNGDILEITESDIRKSENSLPYEPIFVDGLGVGDVGAVVMNDRKAMADSGLIVVSGIIDPKRKQLVSDKLEIISRGFIYIKENEQLHEDIRRVAEAKIKELLATNARDKKAIITNIKQAVTSFVVKKVDRKPIILVILFDI